MKNSIRERGLSLVDVVVVAAVVAALVFVASLEFPRFASEEPPPATPAAE